ncbi:MAG: site-specific integrase [Planctomycetes bacterium]|nr:site-specific integrase [Planctomycetota bacterium]
MPKRKNPYKRKDAPRYWWILYRDASGKEIRESTRSTNERVAQQILADKRLEVERIRAGIVDRFAEQRRRPLDEFVVDYRDHLRAENCAPQYVRAVVQQLREAIANAHATTLADFTAAAVARHVDELKREFSAKTAANHITTLRAFGNWLLTTQQWAENPFASLKARSRTRDGDRKFRRRGLTLAEVEMLAEATLVRPIQNYAKSHGGRVPKNLEELERVGRDRALLYWTAATTGLRASELGSIRWEDLDLGGDDPHVTIGGQFTKNRKDARIPLQGFVAAALKQARQERGAIAGKPVEQGDLVFHIPDRLPEHVRLDAKHAGIIPTHRPADRRVDFHCLRYSCVRILRELGVPVEVAQKVMRHSSIVLTLETYGTMDDEIVAEAMRDRVPAPRMFSQLCSDGGPGRVRRDAERRTDEIRREGEDDAATAV